MNNTPTRNDPCPCSSGKKYKRCCGFKADTQKQLHTRALRQMPAFGKAAGMLGGLAKASFSEIKLPPITARKFTVQSQATGRKLVEEAKALEGKGAV